MEETGSNQVKHIYAERNCTYGLGGGSQFVVKRGAPWVAKINGTCARCGRDKTELATGKNCLKCKGILEKESWEKHHKKHHTTT